MPWYLYDGEANAQEGVKVDLSRKKDIKDLKFSMPGPCSDDFICLLLRLATKNAKLRRKIITIDKLHGCPVLFIGMEDQQQKYKYQHELGEKPDSQIVKSIDRRMSRQQLKSKKRKKRRQ